MDFMRPRIMIVDDDPGALDIMKAYLEDIADVETVTSGRQAVQLAQQRTIDMILLDLEMPVMDGFKTLEQLRNLKECINVPVIMITGKKDRHSVMNSLIMGIDGYLLKPVDKDMLREKIAEILEKNLTMDDRKTVLAIDDDMSYLKQLDNYLQDSYHLVMINSARLALNYLSSHVPDIILLDYQIPLYSGVALIHMIRKNPHCKNIPFIILSGSLDRDAIKEFYPYNPNAYLVKPVEKEVLLEKIQQVLAETEREEWYD